MIDKLKVESHFHRASSSYDDAALIQRESAALLIDKLEQTLPYFNPTSILDLDTGTGYIPELLLKKFPSSLYSLNDIAKGMLEQVRHKFKANNTFSFILGDMENIDFLAHDLVTSNFALQWVDDFSAVITKLYKNSKVLAFSCLLDGTFEEWRRVFEAQSLPIPTYHYPSQKEMEELLLSLNPPEFSFEARDYKMTFQNALTFIRHLKRLGALTPNYAISLSNLKSLINNNDRKIIVNYKVFFAILRSV